MMGWGATGPPAARSLAMIDDLLTQAASKTRLNETQALAALAGSLGLMKKHGDPAKVQALFAAVPGTADLAEAGAAAAPKPKGGLFGGLAKAAGGAAAPDALALLDRLKAQGVSADDLKALLPVARGFVQERTGKDLLGDALRSIPGAGALPPSPGVAENLHAGEGAGEGHALPIPLLQEAAQKSLSLRWLRKEPRRGDRRCNQNGGAEFTHESGSSPRST